MLDPAEDRVRDRRAANKAIVARLVDQVINAGDLGAVDEIFAPECVAGARAWIASFRAAFPDMHMTTIELVAEGDTVIGRFTCTATHRGRWLGHAPTGRRFTAIDEVNRYRIQDSRIIDTWTLEDNLTRLGQLGLVDDPTSAHALHPLLAQRFSPASFDPDHEASRSDLALLLEAARWSPSAGNSQPWAFIAGRRGDDIHARLMDHLAPSSARWAPTASVLVANLAHRYVEGTDWEYSEFSHYDLGQAVAHMTLQAHSLGLAARQFRAFDRAGLAASFVVPEHWEVTTMTAFGAVPSAWSPELGPPPRGQRERKPISEVQWPVD